MLALPSFSKNFRRRLVMKVTSKVVTTHTIVIELDVEAANTLLSIIGDVIDADQAIDDLYDALLGELS